MARACAWRRRESVVGQGVIATTFALCCVPEASKDSHAGTFAAARPLRREILPTTLDVIDADGRICGGERKMM